MSHQGVSQHNEITNNYPSPEEIKEMLIFDAPTPVQKVVDHYAAVLQELQELKAQI